MSHGATSPYANHGNSGQQNRSSIGEILNMNNPIPSRFIQPNLQASNLYNRQSRLSGADHHLNQEPGHLLPNRHPDPIRGHGALQNRLRDSSPLDPDITNFLRSDNNLSPQLTSNSSDSTSNLPTLDPSIANPNNPTESDLFPSGGMSTFETLASQSDLDPEHRESARAVVNWMGDNTGLIALTVYTAHCHQDIVQRLASLTPSQPSASSPTSTITLTQPPELFKATVVLKADTTKLVLKYIGDPTLEAYTDTEGMTTPDGTIGSLDNSLVRRIMTQLYSKEMNYKIQNLAHVGKGPINPRASKDVLKFIKDKSKIGREALHHILLKNACNHRKRGTILDPLPKINDLTLLIIKFPGAEQPTDTDKQILKHVGFLEKSRYAYLRMEAVFLQIKSKGDGNAAIWKRIDGRLAQLRLKGPRFTEAFYKLVLDADDLLFNGQNTVNDLEDLTDFELPTDSDSQAAVARLAPNVSAESGSHMNIGE